MALITDINTAGASDFVIVSEGGEFEILVNGTWNGGSITIEKQISDESWRAIATFTDNDSKIIGHVGTARYRTNTTHGGSAPNLVFDVAFGPMQAGGKYGVSGRVE